MDKELRRNYDYYRNGKEESDMHLHYMSGYLIQDGYNKVPSVIQLYHTTIYSDEYIGEVRDSDMLLGYNEDGSMWLSIKNADGSVFTWDSQEEERKVTIILYLLMQDSEYLIYRSNKDHFCYLVIPQEDPRGDKWRKIPNSHLVSNYRAFDDLLQQTNRYYFKCNPDRLER